jgi:hypothetical protein
MSTNLSYKCIQCGHEFDKEGEIRCPICGSDEVENRFLFGTPSAEDLTAKDYIDALLALCCGDAQNLNQCPLEDTGKQEEEE